ncbi:MAG: hypothetical protein AAF197_00250 [Pseudomonadota bacterium]
MNMISKSIVIGCTISVCATMTASLFAQNNDNFEIANPPTISAERQDVAPATPNESDDNPAARTVSANDYQTGGAGDEEPSAAADRLFGTATVTEAKRENGQVYSIEIDHSLGGKQYIEENDADGLSNSKTKDIEDAPNIAKWRIGSW